MGSIKDTKIKSDLNILHLHAHPHYVFVEWFLYFCIFCPLSEWFKQGEIKKKRRVRGRGVGGGRKRERREN